MKSIKSNKLKKTTKPLKQTESNTDDFFIIDNVVYFTLLGRGKGTFAFVSLDKWPIVSKYKWYLGKSGYPVSYDLGKMQLHRFVYTLIIEGKIPSDIYVDHIDHNKLNNTNSNLRLATPQQNSFNKSTSSNKKGVRKISENNYKASVVKNGVTHEIKNIPTEEQAAQVYNLMAEELFGEFAAPNKIDF
ncbi:numod4 NHN endonuclease [Acanthamoeba polyphaga mimivirus]|uniref:Numod4 NHN endonuclease n=1 Tax=Acanthamoeba polyphaga mimivirus Kroon TaxID=3069720 RepID=A0A0G2YB28_9VIRU|nr:numod4 NHN endonuclease [Acanthamoeba polyphaga mimivirus]AKI80291.1 numod4 NHN endonuclease [Acanthamoeba polyphaga mimivirus Kroon]